MVPQTTYEMETIQVPYQVTCDMRSLATDRVFVYGNGKRNESPVPCSFLVSKPGEWGLKA